MENSKYFYIWIGLSVFIGRGFFYFSVYGLVKLFSGKIFISCGNGSSLELGKLVEGSFLYRYWKMINWFQKVYMTLKLLF